MPYYPDKDGYRALANAIREAYTLTEATALLTDYVANPPSSGPSSTDRERNESICQNCGGFNPVWFAPNDLWNRVIINKSLIICPVCFIKLAEDRGVIPTGWSLQEEGYQESLITKRELAAYVNGRQQENLLCRSYLRYPDPHKKMEEHYLELSDRDDLTKKGKS